MILEDLPKPDLILFAQIEEIREPSKPTVPNIWPTQLIMVRIKRSNQRPIGLVVRHENINRFKIGQLIRAKLTLGCKVKEDRIYSHICANDIDIIESEDQIK
jgi:hypothetical protein